MYMNSLYMNSLRVHDTHNSHAIMRLIAYGPVQYGSSSSEPLAFHLQVAGNGGEMTS